MDTHTLKKKEKGDNADHGRITQHPRAAAVERGKCFSLMYICVVSLSWLSWFGQKQLGDPAKTWVMASVCVCVCLSDARRNKKRKRRREREGEGKRVCLWQGSQIKGRKAPFPQLNVPLGGVREGQRKRKVMNRQLSWKAPDLQLPSPKSSAMLASTAS